MKDRIWSIDKIVPGGAGMARLEDGRVAFAHGALPGERIQVDDVQAHKGYAVARSFQVLTPARERRVPPCVLAERGCGCDLMHAEYAAQLEYKTTIVRDALERVGKFEGLPPIRVEASPNELGYRSRVRLHIDEQGRAGYHQRGTRRLLEVNRCPVARPELDRAIERFTSIVREHAGAAAGFSEVELRVAPGDARPSAWLVPRERTTRGRDAFERDLASAFRVVVGRDPDSGVQRWPLADEAMLHVPTRAFVQVNWDVNLLMVEALVAGARERGVSVFLELYAGTGNFTFALLAAGLRGTAIETNTEAVRAAELTRVDAGLPEAKFVIGDSLDHLRGAVDLGGADLVVLDPPRTGAAPVVPELLRLRPRVVAYFSCDPATLARDLRSLRAGGYALEAIRGFDMFPCTHHLEVLAWMVLAPA
jgi:23S rRNA (uracil1939-C5)-methyltransferase